MKSPKKRDLTPFPDPDPANTSKTARATGRPGIAASRPDEMVAHNRIGHDVNGFPEPSRDCFFCLFADDLDEYPLCSAAVEFSVKDLLPGAEIEAAFRDGDDDFPPHDLAFVVSVGVVFAGSVVVVALG